MELVDQENRLVRVFPLKNGKKIELYNKDCLVGMSKFPTKSFDIVVTSPPYNLGVRYNQYNDNREDEEYLDWIQLIAVKIKEKMKDDGSFFLNIGGVPRNPWGPFEIAKRLKDHFVLQNTIHWIKSIYIENESYGEKQIFNVGHYKPINGNRFLNDAHEYIFHLTKVGNVNLERSSIGVPYKDYGNIHRWKNGSNGIRCRGNTWYVPYKTINSRDKERPHPATFPPEIAELCIKLHGIRAYTKVLDPFMGLGNTSFACAKMGVSCVGFEIDRNYFETNSKLLDSELKELEEEEKRRKDGASTLIESYTDSPNRPS